MKRRTPLISRCALYFAVCTLHFALPTVLPTLAKDAKPDLDKHPRVLMTLPLIVSRGSSPTVVLRGLNLSEATEVRALAGGAPLHVKIKSKGKVELPKDAIAEKLGDTQIQIELQVPTDAKTDATLVVVTPDGKDEAHLLRIGDAGTLTPEKKPNNGFRTAQEIRTPTTVVGAINLENEVNVFRVSGKAGQSLSAEVFAARLGSPLDSLLTLYDDGGHIVASNDDAESSDSLLRFAFPHDGTFFLSLTDAYGKGGVMYPYLLQVAVQPSVQLHATR